MNKTALLAGIALMLGACATPASAPIVDPPELDFSQLVGTWSGTWDGQDGVLEQQFGTVSLTVNAQGQITACTLNQNFAGTITVGGQPLVVSQTSTTACSGALVLNAAEQTSASISLKYTYPSSPEISGIGAARLISNTASSKVITGALNNDVTGTTPPSPLTGDLGNLYFRISKQ